MATEAQRKASRKWASRMKQFSVRFDPEKDADVIGRIEKEKNRTEYIRMLVRNDISKNRRAGEDKFGKNGN